MSRHHSSFPLSLVLAAALPSTALAMPPGQTQPHTPPSATQPATPPGTTPSAQPEAQITDEEIVTVLESISNTTAEKARMAQKNAKDRRVKKFADQRVKRSNEDKKRLTAVRNRHKLKSVSGKTDEHYRHTSREAYKNLEGMAKGHEFDVTYIDDEIQALTNVNDMIENRLLPYVSLPELRTELNTIHSQVQSDLKEARKVRDEIQRKPTA